jgi:hypothetical protein
MGVPLKAVVQCVCRGDGRADDELNCRHQTTSQTRGLGRHAAGGHVKAVKEGMQQGEEGEIVNPK